MAKSRPASSGRGSVEAIEKRRAARQLNAIFSGKSKAGAALDGRTEKRRKRLLKELKEGKKGEPLKAIELVSHADELLKLGETVSSIRKNGVKMSKVDLPDNAEDVIRRTQAAYGFSVEAWKILGLKLDVPQDEEGKPSKSGKRPAKRASRRPTKPSKRR